MLEGTDACFAPVLDLDEAPGHPHNRARENIIEVNGALQPAPAPKFSATRQEVGPIPVPGQHTETVLQQLDLTAEQLDALQAEGAI